MDSHYSPEAGAADRIYTRLGCHLDEIDSFDNNFFRLPKSEAMLLDPHARLLLESAQVRKSLAVMTKLFFYSNHLTFAHPHRGFKM